MVASQGPTVGVVGDPTLSATVADAGASATAGTADEVLAADPDWVVAVGEGSLVDLNAEAPGVPVLAVEVDPGVPSVTRGAVADVVGEVLAGAVDATSRRRFEVHYDGQRAGTFLRDAMLVTDEPARISEFAVRSGDQRVARFRADGVVVATPAGSPGYQGDAGGPVLQPGTGVLGAVPVAPFETDSDHWVLDDAAVSLVVHREEPVGLVTDGRNRGRVPPGTPVELVPAGELRLYGPGGDWKNSNGRRSQ
jgi:NAD+ kinase